MTAGRALPIILSAVPDHLFAYGTLQPGLAPAAVRPLVDSLAVVGIGTTPGSLYDLGAYPGAVFDDAAGGTVRGTVYALPADAAAVLASLDQYEGVPTLYRRTTVPVTLPGGPVLSCWAYHYNPPTAGHRRLPAGVYPPMNNPKRPAIGVTVDHRTGIHPDTGQPWERYESNYTYAAAVARAGGLPLLLPYALDVDLIGDYLDRLDGVLLTGGADLDPGLYDGGGYAEGTSPIDPARQAFELALVAEIERRRLPVLGVCLGSQVMNVHRGGSLHQFLPDVDRPGALEHRSHPATPLRHAVSVDTATVLGRAIGRADVSANTYHKQAVDKLGRGLRVIATAPDGVVEAFEDPASPTLFAAVQWHPERLVDEAEHLAPFRLLVEHAKTRGPV